MSSFAAGDLIIKDNAELVKTLMVQDSYLLDINSKWCCYLNKQDGAIQNYLLALSDKRNIKGMKDIARWIPSNVLEISIKIPILSFVDMEDHGWCFGVLQSGKCISWVNLDYEYEEKFIMDLGEELYGDMLAGIMGDKVDEIRQKAQEKRPEYLSSLFESIHFDSFALFGLEKADIEHLKAVLTASMFTTAPHSLVEEFKKTLKIEQMDFVSFDYVSDQEDVYNIIAKS